ncbi:MAG TPA: hypothetical protein QGH84_09225 [Rhodospirillales bacterium]|jgi:hypothetical protein|nr:hypothetical protein [Rhodospirillales bacterium]|tara:strand:+ start:1131 stop:1355 length:225 start_codon:yes stop_codon:yes gene_type:complete
MIKLLMAWGDVLVAAMVAVYALVRVFSTEDLAALEAGKAQEITILFGASLFYILVRPAWKGIQRYLNNKQLENN